jgi:hypothetical protein
MPVSSSFRGAGGALIAIAFMTSGPAPAGDLALDLSRAVIVTPPQLSGPEKKAVALLVDEVEKRTQIRWTQSESWPTEAGPVIAVGRAEALKSYASHFEEAAVEDNSKNPPEGYRISTGRVSGVPVLIR